jgi:ABC-type glycerol-3-phosphate transport system permease component
MKKKTPISYALLTMAGIFSVLPIIWIIYASFMPHADIDAGKIWPRNGFEAFTLHNYQIVFEKMESFPRYYSNSLLLAFSGTFLILIVGSFAAYGLAAFHFCGNRTLFLMFLLTMMIPGEVMLMGQFNILIETGLYNTRTGLLLSYITANLVMTIFLLRNVFLSVPQALIDASKLDGASHWEVFWQIYIPTCGSGLSACAILAFLNIWNEFTFALTMTTSDTAMTLPVGVTLLQGQAFHDSGVLFASLLLTFLPIVIAFIFLQKLFIRGMMSGGVHE